MKTLKNLMNNQEKKKKIIFLGAIIRLPAATQIIEILKKWKSEHNRMIHSKLKKMKQPNFKYKLSTKYFMIM